MASTLARFLVYSAVSVPEIAPRRLNSLFICLSAQIIDLVVYGSSGEVFALGISLL